jgi:C1A family cysteine protease
MGLLEYFENKTKGKYIDGSRLFLYKVTRNLMQKTGDVGAQIRTVMMALILCGVVPEKYWMYDIKKYDIEPTPFCYSVAQSYRTLKYFKVDVPGVSPTDVLQQIKINISSGIPIIFGFSVYKSYIISKTNGGKIPYPSSKDAYSGGHAIMIVGYDNSIEVVNPNDNSKTFGALMIRNSWGTSWGNKGYGWLPYAYVINGLARDFWIILDNGWIDSTNI